MNVFTYGTLRTGKAREDVLPYPRERATIPGRLYDSPWAGFPFVVLFPSTVLTSLPLRRYMFGGWHDLVMPHVKYPAVFPRVHGEIVTVPDAEAEIVLAELDRIEAGAVCYRRGMVTATTANKELVSAWVYYAENEEAIYNCGVEGTLVPVLSGKWKAGTTYNVKEEM